MSILILKKAICKLHLDRAYLRARRKYFIKNETGGTNTSEYCFLVAANHMENFLSICNGLRKKNIVEYGCGDSMGCGAVFVLLGCNRYVAYDKYNYLNTNANIRLVSEIKEMLLERKYSKKLDELKKDLNSVLPIMDGHERMIQLWRDTTDSQIEERYNSLTKSVRSGYADGVFLYRNSIDGLLNIRCDFVFSQAVLEHSDALESEYAMMKQISSLQSHVIDFGCHDCGVFWDQHYYYTESEYAEIMSPHGYLWINRIPYSGHETLWGLNSLSVIKSLKKKSDGVGYSFMGRPYNVKISECDRDISGAYVLLKSD